MKTLYGVPLLDLKILPESMIEEAADIYRKEDPENSFIRLLRAGEEFKEAGLTPIFLCSETLQDLFVTTAEMLQKKLH